MYATLVDEDEYRSGEANDLVSGMLYQTWYVVISKRNLEKSRLKQRTVEFHVECVDVNTSGKKCSM